MWPNKWLAVFVPPLLIAGVILATWLLWAVATDSARLHPAQREIIVRQVENGYVVEAHTRNNPYPYKEAVFVRPDEVGAAVAGLLNERVPGPLWGK